MKIKNYQLEPLHKVLSYGMKFTLSRVRNKFLAVVVEKIQEKEKGRMEIITKLCKKDKEGKPIMENDHYGFTEVNLAKFNKEYQILQLEDNEIELKGDIVQMIENSTAVIDDANPATKGYTNIIEEVLEECKNPKKEGK